MKLYEKIPDMEILSGDTFPEFHVQVTGEDPSSCTMKCILSKATAPTTAVVTKECSAETGGFYVQLTSEDTSSLVEGTYLLHFRLIKGELSYRKLMGRVYVHSVAMGGNE